jgi:cobalt-zinc-cadmium efflux system outer membrane protein
MIQTSRTERHRSAWKAAAALCLLLSATAAPGCAGSRRYEALRRALRAGSIETRASVPPTRNGDRRGSTGAPRPDPWKGVGELSPEALIARVLQRNPSLAAMRAASQAAVERYPQVTALDDPQMTYGLAPATIGSAAVDFGQKVDLSQRFPWPGILPTRGEVALREAAAAGEDTAAVRLRIVGAAREAFFDYYYVFRAIRINDTDERLLLELKNIADTRYAAGLVTKQDALQAEIAHQHLVHQGIVLERMRRVAAARINTLLDLPPEAALPPAPAEVPGPAPIPSIERLRAAALERRPDLRSAALKVKAREADVHLAELAYLPSLSITGTYNSLWQEEDLRPFLGVGINIPIELDRRRAALDEARARLRRAQALLAEQRARVAFQVETAADELTEAAHVVRLYRTSIVPASEDGLAAARSGYEASTNDFLTLIDAERKLTLARLSYYRGLADYHKARARLTQAVGAPLGILEVVQ